jgi:hypothetical protein
MWKYHKIHCIINENIIRKRVINIFAIFEIPICFPKKIKFNQRIFNTFIFKVHKSLLKYVNASPESHRFPFGNCAYLYTRRRQHVISIQDSSYYRAKKTIKCCLFTEKAGLFCNMSGCCTILGQKNFLLLSLCHGLSNAFKRLFLKNYYTCNLYFLHTCSLD